MDTRGHPLDSRASVLTALLPLSDSSLAHGTAAACAKRGRRRGAREARMQWAHVGNVHMDAMNALLA
eukprot:347870-Chlamydomonas_euryale.AAC.1